MKLLEPGPDQESVCDYPRPPKVEGSDKRVQVFFQGRLIADTNNAKRVLETYHPPTFYIPPEDVEPSYLAIYPSRVETCYVAGQRATAQEGDFYGGWITSEIVGPFKGGPGTWGW